MPELYIKTQGKDEVKTSEITSKLEFLGLDENPAIANTYQQFSGQDGEVFTSSAYQPTVVTAKFLLWFSNWQDFLLAKHDVMKFFMQKGIFRIREDVDEQTVRYVRSAAFTIAPDEEGSNWATFSIPFENPTGLKYSLYRSDEIDIPNFKGFTFNQNLIEDKAFKFHFTDKQFKLFNPSDIPIDPYTNLHDLKITMKFQGKSIKLTNITNSSHFEYKKEGKANDVLVLDGITASMNGKAATVDTDYGNLVLDCGWNDIKVEGADNVDITFSFPFIFV